MVRKSAISLAIVHFSISVVAATIDKRIVNGEPAKASDIPFIVSIKRDNGDHNCAGVLLDSYTVLTAAHCLSDLFAESVKAGSLVNILLTFSFIRLPP